MKNFEGVKHFLPSEFAEPEKMDRGLLLELDRFRAYLDLKVIVTYSTDGSHSKNSQHYLGKAVDCIVPDYKGSLFGLYLIAERFDFNGIGIYPKWHYKRKPIFGLHLDKRELKAPYYQRARWIGIPEYNEHLGKKKNEYYTLNPKNMIDLKIIGL